MTENKLNRKNFIAKSVKGIIGVSLLSVIPFKLFSKNKPKFTVKINNNAVKRNR